MSMAAHPYGQPYKVIPHGNQQLKLGFYSAQERDEYIDKIRAEMDRDEALLAGQEVTITTQESRAKAPAKKTAKKAAAKKKG